MFAARARRLVALLVAAGLLAGGSPAAAADPADVEFSDVADGAWYAAHVAHVASLGVTTGYPDGTFRPHQRVSRAHIAVSLVRALGLEPSDNPVGHFDDVAAGAWYAPHVELVAELGITIGCNSGGTEFCPRDPVTRSQMALYVAQAFGLPRADVDEPPSTTWGAGHPAYEAVEAVNAAGITAGCATAPPRFCGQQLATRAHMAAF